LGGAWGYVPNDKFKPSRKVIHLLIEIVAKGGNLLLGVGPTADGLFLPEQVARLEEIGAWLEINGEGIYNTRAIETFQDGKLYFTKGNEKEMYALLPLEEGEELGESISWTMNEPQAESKITVLGEKQSLKWKTVDGKTILTLSKSMREKLANSPAIVFSYTAK
jgi:alpha-L-fucosidase